MIFLTVGSQTPFDRLVQAVDGWCSQNDMPVLAQIGTGAYVPANMPWVRFCSPAEFRSHCHKAELIVAHAGMGSILTALEFGKPMLLLPRRADLQETRNDHQLATARWLEGRPGILSVPAEQALVLALDRWALDRFGPTSAVPPVAQPQLIAALRRFIDN